MAPKVKSSTPRVRKKKAPAPEAEAAGESA
jgi:hypothetical protein